MTKSISRFVLLLAFCVHGGVTPLWSETGKLLVLVQDLQKRPVKGVEIGIEGGGGSGTTGNDGKVLLPLSKDTHENDWVFLQILHSPPGKDLVILSPSDDRTLVPPFKNKAENFVRVVVMERGNLAVLQNPTALTAFAEKLIKANAPKSADKQATEENPRANLEAVAKQFGLSPEDLDKAIKAWGVNTKDLYEAGLAALYARNYDKATADFRTSLSQREEKLASDQKAVAADQKHVADAAFFLGQSLYQAARYKESSVAFQRCLQIRPDDAAVLNDTALSLYFAGEYSTAEPLYRRALAISEKSLGPEHPAVARTLNNLAMLLYTEGDSGEAEALYRRALASEKSLGPDHPDVARNLVNLAELLRAKGDYAGAEPLSRRALEIDENTLGPNHQIVASDLNNLGLLLYAKGDYAGAEPLYRRAIAIGEQTLGPDHPFLANGLSNLAVLLKTKGDYAGAEPLYRRALAISEKSLRPDHPTVALCLNNLATLLYAEGDYAGAEPLYRRALTIDETALGPDHPMTRTIKQGLDRNLQKSGQAAPNAKN